MASPWSTADTGEKAKLVAQKIKTDSVAIAKASLEQFKTWLKDGPAALKGYNFVACAACCVVGVFQAVASALNPFEVIVSAYACFFAFVGCMLEGSFIACSKVYKDKIEFWARFLSRLWGRGAFYLLVAGMQFAQGGLGYATGIALVVSSVGCFIISYLASDKVKSLHGELLKEYCGKQDEASVRAAFEKIDTDKSGALAKEELAVVAKQLGVDLQPGELVAIFDMLDANNDGKISFDEWFKWWSSAGKGEFNLV